MTAAKKEGRAANAAQTKQAKHDFAKDSRTLVAQRQRQRELEAAPVYRTSADRRAELQRIAATNFDHAERIKKALRTGWVTAEEIATYLDSKQPHTRLGEIRERHKVIDRWVLTPTSTGNNRRVKAYRLGFAEVGK